jgi:transcriptional regulator with XRE-family HTH domain
VNGELPRKLAKIIKEKSKAKFKTKIDFAYACDLDERTIRRILKGEQNLSVRVLKQVCLALDLKISDLFKSVDE